MGWRVYGEPEGKRSRIAEFLEIMVCGFIAFTTCIGGWLVYFGMGTWWMMAIALVFAIVMGYKFSAPEKKHKHNA